MTSKDLIGFMYKTKWIIRKQILNHHQKKAEKVCGDNGDSHGESFETCSGIWTLSYRQV